MYLTIQRVSLLTNIPTDREFKKWISAACAAINQPTEITLRIVNAAEGRNLNSAFRGKDYATNVLTFVYHEKKSPVLQGDIILCAQIVAQEARAQQKILAHHYAHLTIHGMLHMAGMDHETSREANKMEALEIKILASLGIENPYLDVE
jgi:probable rRNA maturation factor